MYAFANSVQNISAKAAIQSDGKIIVTASSYLFKFDFAVARFLPNGSIDSSFGTNGQTIIQFKHPDNDIATAVTIDLNDKIILAGYLDYSFNYSTRSDFELARLGKNGIIDSSFGTNGKVQSDVLNQQLDDFAYCVGVQTDGKIIAGGTTLNQYNEAFFDVVRYNNNGLVDSSFGENGISAFTFSEDSKGVVNDITSQPDGKLVTACRFDVGPGGVEIQQGVYFLLYRLNNDGVLPVYITAFTGLKDKDQVNLKWQSSATNINNYEIERSNNIRNGFSKIGNIPAKSTITPQQYSYTDLNPLIGINYYRLNYLDKDGKSNYSNVISVYFDNNKALSIYPNPVKNMINIKGLDKNTSYQLQLSDGKGHIVFTSTINNVSSYSINAQSLFNGIYFLNLKTTNGYKKTVKLLVE
jgi:uncharacterized delta-60 repeat protein